MTDSENRFVGTMFGKLIKRNEKKTQFIHPHFRNDESEKLAKKSIYIKS